MIQSKLFWQKSWNIILMFSKIFSKISLPKSWKIILIFFKIIFKIILPKYWKIILKLFSRKSWNENTIFQFFKIGLLGYLIELPFRRRQPDLEKFQDRVFISRFSWKQFQDYFSIFWQNNIEKNLEKHQDYFSRFFGLFSLVKLYSYSSHWRHIGSSARDIAWLSRT